MYKTSALFLILSLLAGCAHYSDRRGVEVTWQQSVLNQFEIGKSTRADVLKALGPPSQIIDFEESTALYYLYEKREGEGLLLIVYNRFDIDTRYDRAVFFFDADNLLTDYASTIHADE